VSVPTRSQLPSDVRLQTVGDDSRNGDRPLRPRVWLLVVLMIQAAVLGLYVVAWLVRDVLVPAAGATFLMARDGWL
jgi:hypothetical protein